MENNGINNAQALSLAQAAEDTNRPAAGGNQQAAENALARTFFSLIQRIMSEATTNGNSGA